MTRCRYRLPPSADPTRPRCLLDVHGPEIDHAPDVAHEVRRGQPITDGGRLRSVTFQAPRSDVDAYRAMGEQERFGVRAELALAFGVAVRP